MSAFPPRAVEIDTLFIVLALHEPGDRVCRACGGPLGQETGLCRAGRVAVKRLVELGWDLDAESG
ncbi:hypothetical protein O7627_31765 [Solwaraspora sp. WMMD1047]|uniref:hypothetical protein n=1 Tax=Solwaraspora sp. WMMD1047 TaxID=3016102 RepID=UPI002416D57C|nr:hypothetical protein [Solwaraspora sp. WMMD1047]MDG4833854.1 hypothetical protein [Solwaraspora sp. WMMD1047]